MSNFTLKKQIFIIMKNFMPNGAPFWHFCTKGESRSLIFNTDDDYKYGVNAIALSLCKLNSTRRRINVYAFCLMSNHVHFILEGESDACLDFYNEYKSRLRYGGLVNQYINFIPQLISIETKEQFLIEVGYIHRNPLASMGILPTAYPWSTGPYCFNDTLKNSRGVAFNSLSFRKRRKLVHSHMDFVIPDSISIQNDMMDICSFCAIKAIEKLFNNNARFYAKYLPIPYKDESLESKMENDIISFKTDNELYASLSSIIGKHFPLIHNGLSGLNNEQLIKLTRILYCEYHSNCSQISRLLNLDPRKVKRWLPFGEDNR